jgi:hypothetical protein
MPATPLLAETATSGNTDPVSTSLVDALQHRQVIEPIRTSLVIAIGLVVAAAPEGASTFDVAATRTAQCVMLMIPSRLRP